MATSPKNGENVFNESVRILEMETPSKPVENAASALGTRKWMGFDFIHNHDYLHKTSKTAKLK